MIHECRANRKPFLWHKTKSTQKRQRRESKRDREKERELQIIKNAIYYSSHLLNTKGKSLLWPVTSQKRKQRPQVNTILDEIRWVNMCHRNLEKYLERIVRYSLSRYTFLFVLVCFEAILSHAPGLFLVILVDHMLLGNKSRQSKLKPIPQIYT